MPLKPSHLAKRVLKLSVDEFPRLAAERMGQHADLDDTWTSFEPVATTLVDSFYSTLDSPDIDRTAEHLDRFPEGLRGIAYEGAGMGLLLRDFFTPWNPQLPRFLAGPGHPYRGLVLIGAGLVVARLPLDPMRFMARQDPLLQWFVADGYGFYDGFFRWTRTALEHHRPSRLRGPALRTYDQGVGRSLWFSSGADVDRIASRIASFPAGRRGDLWAGVGLACAYAAGVASQALVEGLLAAAGPHSGDLATGVAVAAVLRSQSELGADHTELACSVVWKTDSARVADLARDLVATATAGAAPTGFTYLRWRSLVAARWEHDTDANTTRRLAS